MMRKPLAPLDCAPISVHAPFISYPSGRYRHENAEERRARHSAAQQTRQGEGEPR